MLVIPGRLNGEDSCQERYDNSQVWQLVKPKRHRRVDDRPFLVNASMRSSIKRSSGASVSAALLRTTG
jgi:hypothetical protein